MKKSWCWISLAFLSITLSHNAYSQIDDWLDYSLDCYDNFIPDTTYRDDVFDSRYGYWLSPHGQIRFLAVFVELEYDNPANDPYLIGTDIWDVGSLPRWADSLFAAYDTSNNSCYEEIDIFEHAEANYAGDIYRRFSCGLWRNPNSTQYDWHMYKGGKKYHIPNSLPDLTHEHVFGLEWMPDYVKWYLDGEVINEYSVWDTIPKYPMRLHIDYQIMDDVIVNGQPSWHGIDTMAISYVKVLKLKTDCNTDTYITTSSQFANFDHKVKRTIQIGSPNSVISALTTTDITMRAVEGITIDGEFELPQGAKLTLIVQECPE